MDWQGTKRALAAPPVELDTTPSDGQPLEASFIQLSFLVLCVVTGIVVWLGREVAQSTGTKKPASAEFGAFQRSYLVVYMIAMFADWLQGPYVYALYESYGFTAGDNATLFVAGFGSSMIFGTIVGAMGDRIGRRKSAMLYCFLYIVSCLTKHVSQYSILMIGRITGGIATSLLFSAFESWLVCEHNARGFAPDLLGETFGLAIFGNSVIAILAGFVSQFAADLKPLTPPAAEGVVHIGGYCSPFDVSIASLAFCFFCLQALWSENFGNQAGGDLEKGSMGSASSQLEGLQSATSIVLNSPDILCCGVVSSLFEASMYIFVFQWTPTVSLKGHPPPPFGHIFATFMVAAMLGSRVFSTATKFLSIPRIGQILLALAAVSHLIPVVTSDPTACFGSFLVFEMCVGIFFPMMGTLKGKVVPEGQRSTIYNIFRVPLNLIVVSSLLVKLGPKSAFTLTFLMLGAAFAAQAVLVVLLAGSAKETADTVEKEEELESMVMPSSIGASEGVVRGGLEGGTAAKR